MSATVAIISGLFMSVQGVWNTALRGAVGMWFTNTLTHGVGFIVSLIALAYARDADITGLKAVNKMYLLGGVLGVGIVYTVIASIAKLGPAKATMIILITQMTASYLIELFGLFGMEKGSFSFVKLSGIAIILLGIIVFQHQ
ncbi:MAG: hypothetical protein ATN35_11990 [Epulopiscium sp. Nele67-Bin004]|nr:MAG: hypothetical protein ATN35_11990 [Epulopiscium sp. Nele67-Bin004]